MGMFSCDNYHISNHLSRLDRRKSTMDWNGYIFNVSTSTQLDRRGGARNGRRQYDSLLKDVDERYGKPQEVVSDEWIAAARALIDD